MRKLLALYFGFKGLRVQSSPKHDIFLTEMPSLRQIQCFILLIIAATQPLSEYCNQSRLNLIRRFQHGYELQLLSDNQLAKATGLP
ncbi:hypothetical protein HDF11_005199 [Tunturiibacter psychrotolerans]